MKKRINECEENLRTIHSKQLVFISEKLKSIKKIKNKTVLPQYLITSSELFSSFSSTKELLALKNDFNTKFIPELREYQPSDLFQKKNKLLRVMIGCAVKGAEGKIKDNYEDYISELQFAIREFFDNLPVSFLDECEKVSSFIEDKGFNDNKQLLRALNYFEKSIDSFQNDQELQNLNQSFINHFNGINAGLTKNGNSNETNKDVTPQSTPRMFNADDPSKSLEILEKMKIVANDFDRLIEKYERLFFFHKPSTNVNPPKLSPQEETEVNEVKEEAKEEGKENTIEVTEEEQEIAKNLKDFIELISNIELDNKIEEKFFKKTKNLQTFKESKNTELIDKVATLPKSLKGIMRPDQTKISSIKNKVSKSLQDIQFGRLMKGIENFKNLKTQKEIKENSEFLVYNITSILETIKKCKILVVNTKKLMKEIIEKLEKIVFIQNHMTGLTMKLGKMEELKLKFRNEQNGFKQLLNTEKNKEIEKEIEESEPKQRETIKIEIPKEIEKEEEEEKEEDLPTAEVSFIKEKRRGIIESTIIEHERKEISTTSI